MPALLKLNDEMQKTLCALAQTGLADAAIARSVGITAPTLARWLKRGENGGRNDSHYKAFYRAYQKAKAAHAKSLLEEAKADAREGGKFKASEYRRTVAQMEKADARQERDTAYKIYKSSHDIPTTHTEAFDKVALDGLDIPTACSACNVDAHPSLEKAEHWFEMETLRAYREGTTHLIELLERRWPLKYGRAAARNPSDTVTVEVSEKDKYHKMRIKALMRGEK